MLKKSNYGNKMKILKKLCEKLQVTPSPQDLYSKICILLTPVYSFCYFILIKQMIERFYIRVKYLIFSYGIYSINVLRKFEIVNCVLKQSGCRLAGSSAIPVCCNICLKKKR